MSDDDVFEVFDSNDRLRRSRRRQLPGDPPTRGRAVVPPKEKNRSLTNHTTATVNTNPLGGQTQDSGLSSNDLIPNEVDPNEVDLDPHVSGTFNILSIDGGGARGMIPAVILEEVERRSGRRISSMFHRICGTSTGAILACGLAAPETAGSTTPRFRAREIVEIYRTLGADIFSRGSFNETVMQPMEELLGETLPSLIDDALSIALFKLKETSEELLQVASSVWQRVNAPLHDVNKLAYVLHEHLGDLRMNDALTELFVYAYDIGSRTPEVLGSVASSIAARAYSGVRMYQAATASSAAVPFFGPYRLWRQPNKPAKLAVVDPISGPKDLYLPPTGSGDDFDLVDGGNGGMGNPSLFALHEETDLSAGHQPFILSLGTGKFSEPITTEARGWGFLQWLGEGDLLNNVFDGESDVTDMVLHKMDRDGVVTYCRWQPPIPEHLAFLDEGSVEDMNALEDVARTYIADPKIDEEIDELVERVDRLTVFA
jgi:predicted acylesterase/phospholipase RssA